MRLFGTGPERVADAQRRAQRAQEEAHRSKEAARRAAEEARAAGSHAAELARIAAAELSAQARQLREPTKKAASRARDVGMEAWAHRDQAQQGARRALGAGARAGRELTSSALSTIERVKPAARRKPEKKRGRGKMGRLGALVAAGGLAMAVPQVRNVILGRLRTVPQTVKRAPQQARQAASSLTHRRSGGESANGSPGENGGLIRGVTGVPRAIRERFRTSVEEGKKEARDTEATLRERYEASKEGE